MAPRRSPATPHRARRRPAGRLPLSDPRRWLKGVMILGALDLLILPRLADAVNAVLKPADRGGCRVASVIDGDTVRLWCRDRGLVTARLRGFDAPEVFSPACPSEWTRGIAATWALRRILFGAGRLEAVFAGHDRYGRALVSLAADGRPVARRMIAEGHARPYAGGFRRGWCP